MIRILMFLIALSIIWIGYVGSLWSVTKYDSWFLNLFYFGCMIIVPIFLAVEFYKEWKRK